MGRVKPRDSLGEVGGTERGGVMSQGNAQIASVRYSKDYKLDVTWSNRRTLTVDFSEPIFRLKGLRPIRDTAAFARAHVGEGGYSVEWSDEIDMAASKILEMGLEQIGDANAVEFLRWLWRNELSLNDAANALGMSRRQIAYYSSGEQNVPRYVALACIGWEARHLHRQVAEA
jgi:hypothetical protein